MNPRSRLPDEEYESVRPWQLYVVRYVFGLAYPAVGLSLLAILWAGVAAALGHVSWAWPPLLVLPASVVWIVGVSIGSRRWLARATDEVKAKIGARDPGRPPVGCISEETWRRENVWDPVAEVMQPEATEDLVVVGLELIDAVDADRVGAPKVDLAPPAQGATPTSEADLRAARAPRLHVFEPRWPRCCGEIATLVGLHGVDEPFVRVVTKAHFLRAELERSWDLTREEAEKEAQNDYGHADLVDGHALFHCPSCGSVYLASREP